MDVEHSKKLPIPLIILYALAWAGGTVAYTPFITVLLPVKITAIAGAQQGIVWTAYIAFFGAIAASFGAIVFGYLSDITRNRHIWIYAGLLLSCLLLLATVSAKTLVSLVTIIILWQIALNMLLAPLAAFAADNIPDDQKGTLGGFLAFAPGIGALSATVATYPGLASTEGRIWLVCAIVLALVLPILLFSRATFKPVPKTVSDTASAIINLRSIAVRMWFARLAIQISEAALFSYLYFWLRTIDPTINDSQTARIFTVAMVLSAPTALLIGRWADISGRPIFPLSICAAIASLSLLSMSLATNTTIAIGSYGLFGVSSSVFLALHTAQTLSVLPRQDRRGRDLGLFNLTNTLPSLILPIITLVLVPKFGFQALFIVLSILAALGSFILMSVKIKN